MKKTISFKSIVLSLLIAIVSGLFLGVTAGIPAAPLAGSLFAASFLPGQSGVALMAIEKEIWMKDIVGNLFKANPHLNYAVNADAFVLEGRVVHIPNAGAKPAVKRNRKDFPASITLRQDVDITFVLDEYTSDPMKLKNAEKYETSYDKRQSLIGEQSSAINELVGDWFYRYWAPIKAAQIKRTTGAAVGAHYGTGNRKLIQLKDVKGIQTAIWNSSYPKDGWMCSMDGNMMGQFTDLFTDNQVRDFSRVYDPAKGVLGNLFGFTFLEPRATVLRYNNNATPAPQDPDAAIGAADNAGAIFWHPQAVIRALGEKEFFDTIGDPTHYGDIFSALINAGGRIKRNDGKGVFTLVQAAE